MKKTTLVLTIVQAAIVVAVLLAIPAGLPLGVPGQWEWMRISPKFAIPWAWLALGALFVIGYASFAALGARALSTAGSRWREARWLVGLASASLVAQVAVTSAAPDECDLTKWAYVNFFTGSAGYFTIARDQAQGDAWRFLADYPRWIESQDSLHIGTHPPGLILAQCALLRVMSDHPGLATNLERLEPPSTAEGFRQLAGIARRPVTRAERGALFATSLITLLACALVVIPLYLLARVALSPRGAWCAAALWPFAPSAILFQPLADTAYPFLATSALALAAWSARPRRGPWPIVLAALAGGVMAFGSAFTLAFLPVGVMVALVFLLERETSVGSRLIRIVATGVGYVVPWLAIWLVTAANPLTIALWNLHHHARFYDEYPRSYWRWLMVNPAELLLALGAASSVWCLWSLARPRGIPRSALAAMLVLVLVNLTGRNLGEVARLWMLFMPALLPAAGGALDREGAAPAGLAATTALLGAQTLALESMIQVVYPVS